MFLTGMLAGMMIGGCLGVLIVALMVAARNSQDEIEQAERDYWAAAGKDGAK